MGAHVRIINYHVASEDTACSNRTDSASPWQRSSSRQVTVHGAETSCEEAARRRKEGEGCRGTVDTADKESQLYPYVMTVLYFQNMSHELFFLFNPSYGLFARYSLQGVKGLLPSAHCSDMLKT